MKPNNLRKKSNVQLTKLKIHKEKPRNDELEMFASILNVDPRSADVSESDEAGQNKNMKASSVTIDKNNGEENIETTM